MGLELDGEREQVLLQQLDADGDGSISYDEFLWWWGRGLRFPLPGATINLVRVEKGRE